MSRLREEIRFRFVRLVGLALLPYWYARIHVRGVQPMDFFLGKLGSGHKSYTLPVVLVVVLSMAARSCDAPSALAALKRLKPPFPIWALSHREIRLLLESPLWLGAANEFDVVRQELLRNPDASTKVRSILASYEAIARNETGSAELLKDKLVLPALHWERLARKLQSEGKIRESGEALYQALRFLPEIDPRRAELVVRLVEADAISAAQDPR